MKTVMTVMIVLIWQLPAISQTRPQPSDPHGPALAVAHFLQFTETQSAQFLQEFDSFQAAMHNLQTQVQSRQHQLDQLVHSPEPNLSAIGQAVIDISVLQSQGAQIIASYHNAFNALLTPEQHQKVQMVIQARQLVPAIGAFAAVNLIEPPAR